MRPGQAAKPASAEIVEAAPSAGRLARLAIGLAAWSEQWFPDAFVFALAAILVVFVAGLSLGNATHDLIRDFGEGFWSLIPFTLQMTMIIVGGYVVATSPPLYRLIRWLSETPRTPRGAVTLVAFFSLATAMISWGFSAIFSALLVREIVKHVRGADYRALGAAAYVGMGSIWALGLSSSAALMMATPSSIPAALLKVSGVIPLSQTIYAWQSLATAVILFGSSLLVAYLSAPEHSTRTAESFAVADTSEASEVVAKHTPAEWMETVPLLSWAIGALGLAYLTQVLFASGPLAALDLNTYNLLFLMLGLGLHRTPRSFVKAVNGAVPAAAGVLIQFPFYGGIFGIITLSTISPALARLFVHISTKNSFPALVSVYSAILGMFVPSGGGKWIIEAPYVLQAAKDLHVNLGWIVQTYNTSEALPNLINPFWMLPLLGLLKMRARDLIGFTVLQFAVNSALVLFCTWFFARTVGYVPPILPR